MKMFIQNKYTRWYYQIIESSKTKSYSEKTTRHHIIPKSLGGSNDRSNLIDISAREHFICHWLLVKMTLGKAHFSMLHALRMMRAEPSHYTRYHTKITSRVYANLKEEYARLQSEKNMGENNPNYNKPMSEENKEKIRQKNTGSKLTEDQCEKVRQSKLNKKREPFSKEWKENLSKNHRSKHGYDCSLKEETKKKIGDKNRGRKQSAEEKKQRGDSVRALELKREKNHCIHCNRDIAVNGYARFHGDRCKFNPNRRNK